MEPIEITETLKIVDIIYRGDMLFLLLVEETVAKLSTPEKKVIKNHAARFDTRVKNIIDPLPMNEILPTEVAQKVTAKIKKLKET